MNKNAIELLKENPEMINWNILSSNKNAIELLKNNQDKIDYYNLSKNKGIFIKKINIEKRNNVSKVLSIILIS
jgi:hypothetical protein